MFSLHPRLAADTIPVAQTQLCSVLLMNNALFPWVILVPRLEDITEITDLTSSDRYRLMDDIGFASSTLQRITSADKMNIAALGNQVPQLHIHVIARFKEDAAWPNPVWGMPGKTYAGELELLQQLQLSYQSQP